MIGFLHDPTWTKVHVATAVAFCGVIGLIALRIKIVRGRRRNVNDSSLFLAEIDTPDNPTDLADAAMDAPKSSLIQLAAPRKRRIINLTSCFASVTITTLASIFAVHNYAVLNNWQEGNDRSFINDYVGAIVCYKKALRVDPSLRHTHLLMGIALLKSNRDRSAIHELQIAANGEIEDAEPATVLGDALMISSRPSEAVEAYKQAISIAERTSKGISTARTADYYIALAVAYERLRRRDEAYNAYQKAIEADPRCARAHVKLGELLVSTGHLDEAMAHCKRAVDLATYDPIAHNTLAMAYATTRMYSAAIEEYKRSIALDPRSALTYYDLGALLVRSKDLSRSLDAFRSAANLTPRNSVDIEAIRRAQHELNRIHR